MPQGLLGYDPKEMQRQAMFKGLLGAGIGLLSQPASRFPISFGQSIGQGLGGFAQGMDQGRQSYMDDWQNRYQMSELQRKEQQRAKIDEARNKWYPQLTDEERMAADADPDGFWSAFSKELAGSRYGSSDEFGLAPIYGVDAQGNRVMMQARKGGGVKRVDLPEGVTLSPGVEKVDLGTAIGIFDRDGKIVGTIPKDVAGAKAQEEIGKGQGEAEVAYKSMQSKMPGLESTVAHLDQLAEKATYTLAGRALDEGRRQIGIEPREAALARTEYMAVVDNQVLPLLRDTFGAQFTEREGATLRATLGDPNISPQEKQAVLKAFIEQKRRDVEALARQRGGVGRGADQSGVADLKKKYGLE
jgi:hypothetical protein